MVIVCPERFAQDALTFRGTPLAGGVTKALIEAAYDVTEGRVTRYAGALGYNAPDYAITFHALHNLNLFTAAYYHKVSADVEAGAKAVYDTKATTPGVALEVGGKA